MRPRVPPRLPPRPLRRGAVLAVWLAVACHRAPSSGPQGEALGPAPSSWHGRAIAAAMVIGGADWLDRPEREATEQPEKVLDLLAIAPRSHVADVGAGTGYFALRVARRVGPAGSVLATDLEPRMLATLRAKAKDAGLWNVETVVATEADAKLPEASLDLALMVDVYHELARPSATLAQVKRALRPGGRLALVEYRGEDPMIPIKEEHRMTLAQIEAEVVPEGWRVARVFEDLPTQRVVVLVPAGP